MKGEKPYVGSAFGNMERTGISGIITMNLMLCRKVLLKMSRNTADSYWNIILPISAR